MAICITTPDGVLLDITLEDLEDIQTGYDALKAACASADLSLTTRGSGAFLYIVSIGDWKEFRTGPLSGWIFRLNGEKPAKSAGVCDVKAGDKLEFSFVDNFIN